MSRDAELAALRPGSPEALRHGCTCDAELNQHGAGACISRGGSVLYAPATRCPLHGSLKRRA